MATLRLTNQDRESVVKRAMQHKFQERTDALKSEECRIGMAAYEAVLPKAERDAANKLPKQWFKADNCLRFRFDFRHVTLNVSPAVVVPSQYRICGDLGLVTDTTIIAAFEALESEKDLLKEEKGRTEVMLKTLLNRVQTLRQLRETWPEGEPFYAHLKPRDEAHVPMVLVDDLNKVLGIAAIPA